MKKKKNTCLPPPVACLLDPSVGWPLATLPLRTSTTASKPLPMMLFDDIKMICYFIKRSNMLSKKRFFPWIPDFVFELE